MSDDKTVPWATRKEPLYPERAIEIIRARLSGEKLKVVATRFGMTPAGVLHYTRRWHRWYLEHVG